MTYSVKVINKAKQENIIEVNGPARIIVYPGDNFDLLSNASGIASFYGGKSKLAENLIAIKKGENLDVILESGDIITFERFYNFNNLASVEFVNDEGQVQTLLSTDSPTVEISYETFLVYSQGELPELLSISGGNPSLNSVLTSNFDNTILTGESAEISYAYMGLGVLGALGIAGGGGGGGGSSPINPVVAKPLPAQLVDAIVIGVDYYINNVLTGQTNAEGKFFYSANDNITFKVKEITLGTIQASDINADEIVLLQDLVGVPRTSTSDDAVIKLAQFLQTVDADNDPKTITIDGSSKAKVVDGENDLSTTSISVKDVIIDDSLIVSEIEAKSHLDQSTVEILGEDNIAPSLAITDDQDGKVTDADPTVQYTITFSESVTDFFLNDLDVSGGTVSNFEGMGAVYTFDVTAASGSIADITVGIAAGAAKDVEDNLSVVATTLIQQVDRAVSGKLNGTIAELIAIFENTTNIFSGDITISDLSVSAADLNILDAQVSGSVITILANTITGSAAEIETAYGSDGIAGLGTEAVIVNANESASVAQLVTLDGKTTGVITATVTEGDMATLAGLFDANNNNVLTVNVTDNSVDASALNALDGIITENVNVEEATIIKGTAAAVEIAYASTGITGLGNETVNINNGTLSVTQLISLDGKTTGVIIATVNEGAMATLAGVVDANGNNSLTVTVTDADSTTIFATALSALGGKTDGVVTVANAINISGDEAEVTAALIDPKTLVVVSKVNVIFSSSTPITVTKANAIDSITSGVVTASIIDTGVASLAKLADAESNNIYTATIIEASVDATTLNDINSAVANLTVSPSVVSVTETAADIGADGSAVVMALGLTDGDAAVTITDAITVANANVIDAATTGIVTAVIATGSVADLKLLNASMIDNAYTLTFTEDTITAADLNALDDLTSVTLNADSAVTVTGLNGLTLSGTDAIDSLTFATDDTGVSISGLSTGDVLDFSNDSGGSFLSSIGSTGTGNDPDTQGTGGVDKIGEWSYSGNTFSYFDNNSFLETVDIGSGLTLITTGNDEKVTIGD